MRGSTHQANLQLNLSKGPLGTILGTTRGKLGSLVKKAISTELLSLDRSKIEGMFKEIQAIRSKASSTE